MNGQGRPQSTSTLWYRTLRLIAGLVLLVSCAPTVCHAAPTNIRIRVEWGGSESKLWRGSVAIPGGQFSDLRLLSVDADQSGAYVNEGERILIYPRFANEFSGFETIVTGSPDDVVQVSLTSDLDSSKPQPFEISIAQLIEKDFETKLDGGAKLTIKRCESDGIRIRFPGDSMVFSPGERPKIDILAHHVNVKADVTLRARFRLREENSQRRDVTEFWNQGDDLWSRTETIRIDENGQSTPLTGIELPIPDREGSFNLTIDLAHRLPQMGTVERRTIQFVVVDPRRPPLFGGSLGSVVTEFNPAADPNWFDRLTQLPQWSLLPSTKRGPWSNMPPTIWQHLEKAWTKIEQDGWIGYTLPIDQPNIPHILEVEFPAGVEQDVGVSIVEPEAIGELMRTHCETGVTIGDQDLMLPGVSASTETTKHRLVFWPKTTSPVVVISNRSRDGSVTFGKIRLEAFPQGLPSTQPTKGIRKRIAVLDGDMLQQMFFTRGSTSSDPSSTNVDSWPAFLAAGNRLAQYLRYAGYDGATIDVASRGSSLYPSDLLLPTPKFDRGILSSKRQDMFKKDVLELLLRIFDREGLTLIPSIEFATPLTELERVLAEGHDASAGIELTDINGRLGAELEEKPDHLAPYYNPVNQRVQTAMRRVTSELVDRYAHHLSFGGLNIDCKAAGFAQLPDSSWAFDKHTLRDFAQAVLPADSPWTEERLSKSLIEKIRSGEDTQLVQRWLQWRAYRLSGFYQSVADLVGKNGDELFLSMTDLMQTRPWQTDLRPALPRRATVENVLLELGLDVATLQQLNHLVLLRPNRIATLGHLGSQAVNLEVSEPDIQNSFQSNKSIASQFVYESREVSINGFDSRGPTRRTQNQFVSLASRVGADARRHLATSLAQHDDQWIFEGGRILPMGQEIELQSFFEVYRQLPNRKFKVIELEQSAPVVARIAYEADSAIAYFVNTSPWIAQSGIQWTAPSSTSVTVIGSEEEVLTRDLLDRSSFDVTIEPYGIVALRFDTGEVTLVGCRTELPVGVAKQLRVQLDEIVSRERRIEVTQPAHLLEDGGFEKTRINDAKQKNWIPQVNAGGTVETDYRTKASGSASLRLFASAAPVSVVSHDFAAPETGRLVVSLMHQAAEGQPMPRLEMQLESSHENYQPLHRFDRIGSGQFTKESVSFIDLPTDPNLRLRIRIDLVGEGEVWIDDIHLYDKWIVKDEKKVLQKIIQRAVHQGSKGDLAACFQTLSSYWPRFLLRHVPPAEVATLPERPVIPEPAPEPRSKPNRLFDLRRFVPRFR